jgi:GAF domain-containing protein
MPINRDALEAGLSRLARTIPDDVQVDALLEEVVTAVNVLFRLSGAGFLIIDQQHALRSAAASDEAGKAVEEAQIETGEGPCVDAFVRDTTIVCDDVLHDERYRQVGPRLARHGVRAMLGVPVRLGGGPIGALNVYVDTPHSWTAEEQAGLEAYAQLLGALLQTAMTARQRSEVAAQLQYALDYRIVIERAVGFLMARHDLDPVHAFNRLRRNARDTRRRVADVAAEVLEGKELP